MVKFTENLLDLHELHDQLIAAVEVKLSAGKVSSINMRIAKRLEIKSDELSTLLRTINSRFRKCEMIYHTFFRQLDHDVLCGSTIINPYVIQTEFTVNTSIIKGSFEVNDRELYTELIEINFQSYILTLATVFENLVLLKETLVKKVIIHGANESPHKATLDNYLEFLQHLVDLEYRKKDDLYQCISQHFPFFIRYLKTISELRNRYIHGYKSFLGPRSNTYMIIGQFDQNVFSANSPELILDQFVSTTLTNTGDFTKSVLSYLVKAVNEAEVSLPI
jgi:hypothetical protein